ncbi:MAG TPA: EsaB/YukD family protein [Actinoplanes sp.]|nr:EsaB/YukD family protein [Actinoplanes sp.]
MSEQSRITVVGTRRRVDIAVPSWTPIGEYAGRLAAICGQDQADVMPPAWSLAVAGEAAFPLDTCLADLGVVDGQVLYLRDTAVEPAQSPVIDEVDEVVAEETRRLRRERLHGGPAMISAGLLWLFATAALAAWSGAAGVGTTVVLILAGLVLVGAGWALAQQRDTVPLPVRLGVALTAIPCMAAAGVLADRILTGGFPWEGGLIGANLGALLALAALPGPVLFTVQFQLLVALSAAVLVRGLEGGASGAAAVAAVVAMGMLAVSRRIAAFVSSWAGRRTDDRSGKPGDLTVQLVDRSRHLLAAVVFGPALALVVALPVLSFGGGPFGLALTGVVSVVLLVRIRQAAFTAETLAFGLAAAIGCFSLLTALVLGWGLTMPGLIVVLVFTGVLVIGGGVALSVLSTPPGMDPPDGPRPIRRRSGVDIIGVIAIMAMTPLAVGVFGVFGQLLNMGRTMF